MKQFIFLDTNMYLSCSLMRTNGYTIKLFHDIEFLLNNQDFILLLPEVVKLEYFSRIDDIAFNVLTQVNNIKKSLRNEYKLESNGLTDKIENYITQSKKFFRKKIKEADSDIKALFANRNCHEILLNPEILMRSYLRTLRREKPYDSSKYCPACNNLGDVDSIIVECLNDYFKKYKINYDSVLYICTEDSHFFKKNSKQGNSLYPEITRELPKETLLYNDLTSLLKELGKPQEKEIEKDFNTQLKIFGNYFQTKPFAKEMEHLSKQMQSIGGMMSEMLSNAVSKFDFPKFTFPRFDTGPFFTLKDYYEKQGEEDNDNDEEDKAQE